MLTFWQILYLIIALIVGVGILYLVRYPHETGRILGLWRMLIFIFIIISPVVSAQDLDINDSDVVIDDGKPLVWPDKFVPASQSIVDELREDFFWYEGVQYFLGNETVNITSNNGSLFSA